MSYPSMWAAYVRLGRKWDRVGLDVDRDALLRFLAGCYPNRPAKVECIRVAPSETELAWRKA